MTTQVPHQHYVIRCTCGIAIEQCVCPGGGPKVVLVKSKVCAHCRRISENEWTTSPTSPEKNSTVS